MPQYDLKCEACDHPVVVDHPMSEPHPKKCPECGKPKLVQVYLSAPAYHAHYSPMHPRVNRGRGH